MKGKRTGIPRSVCIAWGSAIFSGNARVIEVTVSGISDAALNWLLTQRYGGCTAKEAPECLLEARHFADLFGWAEEVSPRHASCSFGMRSTPTSVRSFPSDRGTRVPVRPGSPL